VIRIDGEQYMLHAAVDPDSNELPHTKPESTRINALAEIFFDELKQKHDVEDTLFLVDNAAPPKEACRRHALDLRYEHHGDRNCVERVFREVKRRTDYFSNCLNHVDPATDDDWLGSFAFAWNQLI